MATWKVDPFSTGALFTGWRERVGEPFLWKTPVTYEPLVMHHVPGQRPIPVRA